MLTSAVSFTSGEIPLYQIFLADKFHLNWFFFNADFYLSQNDSRKKALCLKCKHLMLYLLVVWLSANRHLSYMTEDPCKEGELEQPKKSSLIT